MMRCGANLLDGVLKTAGYRPIEGHSGHKVFPYATRAGTVYVKNTDKLSIVVHKKWDRELQALGAKYYEYKNSNLRAFSEHTATTGVKYGLAIDFEAPVEVIEFIKALDACPSRSV